MSPAILTEDYACAAIMRDRYRRALCLPRYTPRGWWECDVFELTGTGYFREYEVKLTFADFKNDAKKRMEKRPWVFGSTPTWDNKHDLLANADPRGPVEFWFVTSPGLVGQEVLPKWAGLIELDDRGSGHRPSWRWIPRIVVKAPRLHNEKAPDATRRDVLGCCYYRYHEAARANRDCMDARSEWTDEAPPSSEETAA